MPHQTKPDILCHINQQQQMSFEWAGPMRTQWRRIRILHMGVVGTHASPNPASHSVRHRLTTPEIFCVGRPHQNAIVSNSHFYLWARLGSKPQQTKPAILCHIDQQQQMYFEWAGPIRTPRRRIRILRVGAIGKHASPNPASHSVSHRSATPDEF